jgi:hypothetical protein
MHVLFQLPLQFIEANKDKKPQPKSKEPSRSKPHWDFVLEEMTWLAKVNNSTCNQETYYIQV